MADDRDDTTRTAASTSPPVATSVPDDRLVAPLQLRDRSRYEVLGEHGRGGLGRVSRARDKELGRDVAIKELIKRTNLHEIRFLREALITARLEHPGIVPIHEAGRWEDGTPFYAMKLVAGRPLKQLIAACGTAERRRALLPHVIAVADAIAYAHGQRIIHRDLKPSNVIVGDFGETVVIDWGLAKELSATDDAAQAGAHRPLVAGDLTSAGTVVGTPAYMAPEQARGEPVDQRVDVYAIGAMLWELCAGSRVSPVDAHQREPLLRRERIDRDLAAIIGKALAPDPAARYPDAGALAADLKAYQAGARIAARSYSLPAMLAHWTRRHHTLSVSAAVMLAVAIAGSIAFVRNIAIERDRADASAVEARAQQRRAEHTADQLTLQHAELQLHSDPTAAMAILAGYHGDDALALRRLRAEASGRGVAAAELQPHAEPIWFLAADPSGAIISLSQDRTIRLTRGDATTTLASNARMPVKVRYAAKGHALAYATAPTGIGVLSLITHTVTAIPTGDVRALDILADGSRLATLAPDGTLAIWSLAPSPAIVHQEQVAGALDLELVTATRVLVRQRDALRIIALDGHPPIVAALAARDFEAAPDRIVISDDQGNLALLSSELVVRSRISVCHRAVSNVDLVPNTDLVAFVCEEGIAGVARYDAAAAGLTVVDTFPTAERPFRVHGDATGKYILVTDDSNITYLYDIVTRLVTRYEAATRVSRAVLPSPELDRLLVGDLQGHVRIWKLPPRTARKVLQTQSAATSAVFDPDGQSVLAGTASGVIHRIHLPDGAVTELHGHTALIAGVRPSPDGRSILSYSRDGTARLWRTADAAALRVFAEPASTVEAADYLAAGRRVAAIAGDGRLLAWATDAPDGAASVLFAQPLPLTALAVLGDADRAAVQDVAGSIWDVGPGGAHQIRKADDASVTVLRASPDGRLLAIGTNTGRVVIHDTAGWAEVATSQLDAGVRQLRFDPNNRELIVVSEDRHVRSVALGAARTLPWRDLAMPARTVFYSPDGDTLAFLCSDGGTWFYDVRSDAWAYTLDHSSDVLSGGFSPDGARFVSSDLRGAVTVRDVAATLAAARR